MYEHIQSIPGNILAIRITGEISDIEHAQLNQLIQRYIAAWKRSRLLIVVAHYTSFNSAEALYEDLRMVKAHADSIDKMAVVGDRRWKQTWAGLFGLFSGIQTHYFYIDEIEAASQWISGLPSA